MKSEKVDNSPLALLKRQASEDSLPTDPTALDRGTRIHKTGESMKAISLTQPWASLVVEGFKQYETRSWATKYRGPLVIHAGKFFPRWAKDLMGTDDYDGDPYIRDAMNREPSELPLGAILGIVDLTDCQEMMGALGGDNINISEAERAFGDWSRGRFAWKLENPVRFQRPIPVKGAGWFWEIPNDIMWQLEEERALA